MFKLGFAFVAVALFVCSSYADLLTGGINLLTEYSNENVKDQGSDSKTTGGDDESKENDGFGDEASGSKQEHTGFFNTLIFRCHCCR